MRKPSLFDQARRGNMKEVAALLDAGTRINGSGRARHTPLMAAIMGGHLEMVKLLLERGADVNYVGLFDTTALACACYFGNLDIVKVLLNYGADVKARVDLWNSNLITAVRRHNLELARLLINKGININQVGCIIRGGLYPHFGTALTLAALNKNTEMIQLLREAGAKVQLTDAVILGEMETARDLLSNGADVNETGPFYDTGLIEAIRQQNVEMVELLLAWGATISDHALRLASNQGLTEIVTMLMDVGAERPGAMNGD